MNTEGLFDYINECSVALSKVVASQRRSPNTELRLRASITSRDGRLFTLASDVEVVPEDAKTPFQMGEWLKQQRSKRLVMFQEMIAPALESGQSSSTDFDVQIELIEASSKSSSKKKHYDGTSLYPQKSDVFEHAAPTCVRVDSSKSDLLLKQNIMTKPLSRSQSSAVASAGRVLLVRNPSDRIGAAVKRKIKVHKPVMKKQSSKKKNDLDRDGLHIRRRFIFLYFVLPLLLLAIDDIYRYFETFLNVVHSRKDILYHPTPVLHVPLGIRLFSPWLQHDKVFRRTYKVGYWVMEFGGILFLLQGLFNILKLFRAVRKGVRIQILETDYDSDNTQFTADEQPDEDPAQYNFLFKWQ